MEDRIRRLLALAESQPGEVESKERQLAGLRELLTELTSRDVSSLPAGEVAEILRLRRKALLVEHKFSPGELVRWKEGLRNKNRPENGQPAIVVQVLNEPIYDEAENPGSGYFREPLDIVIGVFADNDFMMYYFDKRRFEPYE